MQRQRQQPDNRGVPAATHCLACGAGNGCAIAAGQPAATCWCMTAAVQHPLPTSATASCYCADCLARLADDIGGRR